MLHLNPIRYFHCWVAPPLTNHVKWVSAFVICCITVFACQNNSQPPAPSSVTFQPQSKQDTILKMVTQVVGEDTVTFDYSDFENLKTSLYYDRFFAGEVFLPTGRVVCADPLYREMAFPQTWRIPPGNYPVYLYFGLEEGFEGRVAYAELVVKDEVPRYWEQSLIPDSLLQNKMDKLINGLYPVENGLSCFADDETFTKYEQEIKAFYEQHPDSNYYLHVLEPYFKANAHIPLSSRGEDWANYRPAHAQGNIIMFGSGFGDGLYPRYVGYDANGQVVKFLTDFIQIYDTLEP